MEQKKNKRCAEKTPAQVMGELRRDADCLLALAQTYLQSTTPEVLSLTRNLGNVFKVGLEMYCRIKQAHKTICGLKGGAL